jgi:hypothetical protein
MAAWRTAKMNACVISIIAPTLSRIAAVMWGSHYEWTRFVFCR